MAQKLFNAQTICILCYLIIDHAIHFILSSVPASIKSDTSFLQILFITSKFYLYFSLLVLGELLYHTQNLQKLQ